ncbi:DUF3072 domain-containing protein [Phycicoccus duodecadis]|uniref:DUF3072 family protein n=1 Tax=Phycicoccus duodecadis TaxID=173053 RepID=A0A2N3YJI3_9MICO|nr:DUF3072 domain-containing protein [Phycicoccus duodecadis]PKW26968.1 Protein of unknown function (DUF3072) [Phycicoccus duodecadis]
MSEQSAVPETTDDRHTGETLGSPTPENGPERDPEDWVTGDEPMTGPQRSYLDTLARQAGEELPADLTKAQASEHIERLQGERDAG